MTIVANRTLGHRTEKRSSNGSRSCLRGNLGPEGGSSWCIPVNGSFFATLQKTVGLMGSRGAHDASPIRAGDHAVCRGTHRFGRSAFGSGAAFGPFRLAQPAIIRVEKLSCSPTDGDRLMSGDCQTGNRKL
jgi:hypothetical protein